MGPWVLSGSLGSALGGAEFLRVCLVRSGARWWLLGWFGCVWIVWVRSAGRSVRFRSFSMSMCALLVAGFVLVRVVCPGAPWWSLG